MRFRAFINNKIDGKLFIIAEIKEKSALNRINELLSSSYTPKVIKRQRPRKNT
jgi:hypothetical protein